MVTEQRGDSMKEQKQVIKIEELKELVAMALNDHKIVFKRLDEL